ncbi:PGP1 [Auxenochlorella protothecoides x Auxenochlorella symbiontica]|uniref:CDP-diacylglycerol-glycerol-3-phosphate 3-phosphatidyltransferase n=1 Tax=Auxenochlorella protothecoides TaxID=3075 RepID=A0A1D2A7X6_AUXPR
MKRRGSERAIRGVPLFRVSTMESLDSPIDRRADYYRLTALEGLRKRSTGTVSPFLNLPNLLTISRVFMVPMFVVTWFWTSTAAPATTAALFTIAALTDWLDGYLARRLQLTSAFGAFLDPVADKIMVSTALILLASDPPPPISLPAMVVPVVIMTARELTMSALREWAAAWSNEAHKAVKVNSLGKWKTALQMVAMTALLVLRHADLILGPGYESGLHALVLGALAVLWLAAFLAVWSLVNYMSCVWKFLAST